MTDTAQEQEGLTAIQREYAEAIKRNQTAKAHLENLLKQGGQHDRYKSQASTQNTQSSQPLNSRTRHQRHLATYLQNLRLQRQYNNLQTLAAYTKEIELIAERQHLYDDVSPLVSGIIASATSKSSSNVHDGVDDTRDAHEHDPEKDINTQQRHVDRLLDTAKTLTSNLELALVGARLDLKREQARLEQATRRASASRVERSGSGISEDEERAGEGGERAETVSADYNSANGKLRALQATRTELQRWIAETLRRCEEANEPVEAARSKSRKEEDAKTNAGPAGYGAQLAANTNVDMDVDAEYTRYIAARQRLLRVLDALRRPLPPSPPPPAAATSTLLLSSTRKAQTIHNNNAADTSTTTPTPSSNSSSRSSQMVQRQQQHPPRNHNSRVSLSYTTKTAEFTHGPSLAEIEALHIPSYEHAKLSGVYLADLKRQTHVLDVRMLEMLNLLGHESHLLPAYPCPYPHSHPHPHPHQVQAQGGMNTVHGGRGVVVTKKESVEIERLLEAWNFAAEAADAKLMEELDGDVGAAEMALRGAEERLEEVMVLEGMRREVFS